MARRNPDARQDRLECDPMTAAETDACRLDGEEVFVTAADAPQQEHGDTASPHGQWFAERGIWAGSQDKHRRGIRYALGLILSGVTLLVLASLFGDSLIGALASGALRESALDFDKLLKLPGILLGVGGLVFLVNNDLQLRLAKRRDALRR